MGRLDGWPAAPLSAAVAAAAAAAAAVAEGIAAAAQNYSSYEHIILRRIFTVWHTTKENILRCWRKYDPLQFAL